MKQIDIQEQPILGFGKTAQIAFAAVKYRLFRALVTVTVIAVAMAFLMNILCESLIKKAVATSARRQIEELHRTDTWIARLSVPQSYSELIYALAAQPETDLQQAATASQAAALLTFFDTLNYGRRRVLVGSAASTAIFDRLQDKTAQQTLYDGLANMRSARFPLDAPSFTAFLSAWPAHKAYLANIRSQQQQAIDQIQARLNGRSMLEALQDAQGPFGQTIRTAGFDLSDAEAASVVQQAETVSDTHLIEDTINHPQIRKALSARFDVLPGDVTTDMIWNMLQKQESAAWFITTLQTTTLPMNDQLTPARLQQLAAARKQNKLLIKTELMTTETGGGFMGIGQRMTWLAFVSMLVCVVGIANAMLMSVTERFREIATLKCLGALDQFIMTIFLIEASLLGLVGGVIGTLAGFLLCTGRMFLIFHSLVAQSFPVTQLILAGLISIAIGVILAGLAAVYPSFRAARLAPMEAMRIE